MANVTVGKHYETLIRRMIDSGRYASANEVHREGLKLLEERESRLEALRALVLEGEESGPLEPMESAAELIAAARWQRSGSSL